MVKEVSSDRFACHLVPGENCFSCPYDDCISSTSKSPVSKNEKKMLKDATKRVAPKAHNMDISLSKNQKEHIAKISKRSYQSKLKTYKRSKAWIEKEMEKYN